MANFDLNSLVADGQERLLSWRSSQKRWRGSMVAVVLTVVFATMLFSKVFVTYLWISFMNDPNSQNHLKDSEITVDSDIYLAGLSEGGRQKLNQLEKIGAYTLQLFRDNSVHYQHRKFQCASIFAGDERSVKRAEGIAKVIAWLEEVKHGDSANVARVKVESGLPHSAKKFFGEVTSWPTWEFQKLTPHWYWRETRNCESFKRSRGYIVSPLTLEEENFPIAFSILAYKDVEMVERLLRMIYRPQNSYCVHVDKNADRKFYAALKAIAACFPDNVRMCSRRVRVKWGTYATVEPELACMRDLWDMDKDISKPGAESEIRAAVDKHVNKELIRKVKDTDADESNRKVKAAGKDGKRKVKWKYLINLTGQEFPLKTNYEMVSILKAFNGANNEEGTLDRAETFRWNSASPPPHGINPVKGAVHTIINRATVDFILHDPRSSDFLEWLKGTKFPDETLFSTLNYNPHLGIPGSYNGTQMENVTAFARFKKWNWEEGYTGCPSRLIVRGVCILSSGDLPEMAQSPHLFANKFYLHQDRVVIGCLEELLFNNTRDEYFGKKAFNASLYANQDFVFNQVRAGTV